MNKLYANKIVAGQITLAAVPASRKAGVIAILQEYLEQEKITQEQFDQFTKE